MRTPRTPTLDGRDAKAFARELFDRADGFLPEWRHRDGDPGVALGHAFGRLMEGLASRINAAPDKNRLAFYDLLGASLLPSSPALVPVAFDAIREVASSVVPARTRVGGDGPDDRPVVFETESRIALVAPRLAEVVSLWPARDTWAVHTEEAVRGLPFTLHEPARATEHVLYLRHDALLSFVGPSVLEVRIDLARPGAHDLDLVWEYWDGEVWREFKPLVAPGDAEVRDSVDGTDGLRRSGVVRLVTDCARTGPAQVDGLEGFWVRARARAALPPAAAESLPVLEDLRLQSLIDRGLPATDCTILPDEAGILADQAFGDGQKLDLSKAVEPFGGRPKLGAEFRLSSPEVFGRPGAEVTLCFRKVVTPEEKADEESAKFEVDVASVAATIVEAAKDAAGAVVELITVAGELAVAPPANLGDLLNDVADARDALATEGMWGIEALDEAVKALRESLVSGIGGWLVEFDFGAELAWVLTGVLPDDDDDILDAIFNFRDANEARIVAAFEALPAVAQQARGVLNDLEELTPYGAALAAGATLPSIADPVVAWEFFDGRKWRGLEVEGAAEAINLTGSGPVTFTVPERIAPGEIDGVDGTWIRARLVAGGYGIVRLVAWKDENTGATNFFPVVEYRPPVLERVRLGYTYRSPSLRPTDCLAHNDFRFRDRSADLAGTGRTFRPFEPVADDTPALYLGFDGPLPRDVVGLLFDMEEAEEGPAGPRVVWEGWDDGAWRTLDALDETRNFAVPGIVSVTWPGYPAPPSSAVVSANERALELPDADAAALFRAGDRVWLARGEGGEIARVADVGPTTLSLSRPPEGSYAGGRVHVVSQGRFGTPRTWIRARMAADEDPLRAVCRGLYANAVWTSQVETHERETVGSSDGEPDQTFFVRRAPVVGPLEVEVRELTGPRAEIEGPLLRAELEESGRGGDYREELDPRTNRVRAVWVRWRERPSLLFSEPGARDYAVERTRGRLSFGNASTGRIPPPGSANIVVSRYRSGGGAHGNLPAGGLTQLLSGVVAKGVRNPLAASGGAPGETSRDFLDRGPDLVRHRRQSISREDYEDLALEATPALAVARALPATRGDGRRAPGWVTVQVVPHSAEPRPHASFALREQVRRFIEARSPAAVRGRVAVVPAAYHAVGVMVRLRAARGREAWVAAEAERLLTAFLHPLTGGPEGRGWRFGRDVHDSDLAGLLGGIEGLDAIPSLVMTVGGSPVPSPVPVPDDGIVVAGRVDVLLEPAEDA